MPSRHSSVVGGSSSARVVNCPGSGALLDALPAIVHRDSSYAIEGTALHTCMEELITGKVKLAKMVGRVVETDSGPVTITQELVHDALTPAWNFWTELSPTIDTWQLETEVHFPGLKGAFGTADVIARDDQQNITHLPDWKFGAGQGVLAAYPDPDDPSYEIVNEQLLFYAVAARNTQPEFFPPGCTIRLTIVQPRARDNPPITSVDVTHEDLDAFQNELIGAVKLAQQPNAPTKRGRWCSFQPCQTVCPHFTGPLIDLNVLATTMPEKEIQTVTEKSAGVTLTVIDPKTAQLAQATYSLVDILAIAPVVETLIREARAQAHIILSSGGKIEGWKLVAKRGTRQWTVDEKALAKALKHLKIKPADLYEQSLRSPAQIEKLLPKKTKLPEGLTSVVSSGTTIAVESDKRPAVEADPNALQKTMLEILGEQE